MEYIHSSVEKNELSHVTDGSFERDELVRFVAENKLPLVITFNKESSALIFESPIKRQVCKTTYCRCFSLLFPYVHLDFFLFEYD